MLSWSCGACHLFLAVHRSWPRPIWGAPEKKCGDDGGLLPSAQKNSRRTGWQRSHNVFLILVFPSRRFTLSDGGHFSPSTTAAYGDRPRECGGFMGYCRTNQVKGRRKSMELQDDKQPAPPLPPFYLPIDGVRIQRLRLPKMAGNNSRPGRRPEKDKVASWGLLRRDSSGGKPIGGLSNGDETKSCHPPIRTVESRKVG